MELEHLKSAEGYLAAAEEIAQQTGDWLSVARVRRYLGFVHYRMGHYREVLRLSDLAITTVPFLLLTYGRMLWGGAGDGSKGVFLQERVPSGGRI